MKIINNPLRQKPTTTTLNEIPVGQVFSGTIISPVSKRITTGIFYKLHGPTNVQSRQGTLAVKADVLVVRLDEHDEPGSAPLWKFCSPVENYQPLEAELLIKLRNV